MTTNEKIDFLLNLSLSIKYEDGRQLQFFSDGQFVDAFDPVYEISINDDVISIIGCGRYEYFVNMDSFDIVIDKED